MEKIKKGDEVALTFYVDSKNNHNYVTYIAKPLQEQDSTQQVEAETIKDNDTLNSPELLALMKIAAEEHKIEYSRTKNTDKEPRSYEEILDALISIFHRKVSE